MSPRGTHQKPSPKSLKGRPKARKPPPVKRGDPRPTDYELYRRALETPPSASPGSTNQFATVKTPTICAAVLVLLAKGHTPAVVGAQLNIARSTLLKWRRDDPQFAEAWEEAVEAGVDLLEEEIRRRAVSGVDRPVFQKGECVGFVREYSDSLAAMMLQGRRRRVYGRNADENDGQSVTVNIRGGLPDAGASVTVEAKKDKT